MRGTCLAESIEVTVERDSKVFVISSSSSGGLGRSHFRVAVRGRVMLNSPATEVPPVTSLGPPSTAPSDLKRFSPSTDLKLRGDVKLDGDWRRAALVVGAASKSGCSRPVRHASCSGSLPGVLLLQAILGSGEPSLGGETLLSGALNARTLLLCSPFRGIPPCMPLIPSNCSDADVSPSAFSCFVSPATFSLLALFFQQAVLVGASDLQSAPKRDDARVSVSEIEVPTLR